MTALNPKPSKTHNGLVRGYASIHIDGLLDDDDPYVASMFTGIEMEDALGATVTGSSADHDGMTKDRCFL